MTQEPHCCERCDHYGSGAAGCSNSSCLCHKEEPHRESWEGEFDDAFLDDGNWAVEFNEEEPHQVTPKQVKSFIDQELSDARKEERAKLAACFKETKDMQHDDEMHCSCLGYAEWCFAGKPDDDVPPAPYPAKK